MVKPLCPLANLFGGCFRLGSGPFRLSGLLFLLTKRKSGWGICGSSGWVVCCCGCCDLPAFPDRFGPCTKWRFTAYAHVRTEPQCDIGQTRGKKKSPELTSELLHCLSTLPDPWPLAKVTIDMEKPSQWVSKMCRLFFADDYARRTVGVPTAAHGPEVESALQAVHSILPKLEARIIEFLSEWLVTFLMPAKHVLETRAPHLYFMFLKAYWFRELYLGLKVTASFDRSQSYTRIIDGQVWCITPDFKPKDLQIAWNVQFITVVAPAWMIPPIYHSLRRKASKMQALPVQ